MLSLVVPPKGGRFGFGGVWNADGEDEGVENKGDGRGNSEIPAILHGRMGEGIEASSSDTVALRLRFEGDVGGFNGDACGDGGGGF